MIKNITLLFLCQALTLSCGSLIISSSALVGQQLAPSPQWSTLPLGLMFTSTMLCTLPASYLMQRVGRQAGFLFGAVIGICGGTIAAIGIYHASFGLFVLGSIIFGGFVAFGQFFRFAAAEVAAEEYRSRAISWVLAGGLIAAFVGPALAVHTRYALPEHPFSGAYAAVALLCAVLVLVLMFLRIPKPDLAERQGKKRHLPVILKQPVLLLAVSSAVISYGIMTLLMTATPLAMKHHDLMFSQTAYVIQWHLVGMFAPSFFTGSLIHRFGVLRIMILGSLMLMACIAVTLSGLAFVHFWLALFLLGCGWNFLFTGATTLLTESYHPAEKASVQGINDMMVYLTTSCTALSAGYFHHQFGWQQLNLATIPVLLLSIGLIVWYGLHSSRLS